MNQLNNYDIIRNLRKEHHYTQDMILDLLDTFNKLLVKDLTDDEKKSIREEIQIKINLYKNGSTNKA